MSVGTTEFPGKGAPSLSASCRVLGRGEGVEPPGSEARFFHSQKNILFWPSLTPGSGMEPGMRPGLVPGPSFSFLGRGLGTQDLKDAPMRSARAPLAPASSAPNPRPPLAPGRS